MLRFRNQMAFATLAALMGLAATSAFADNGRPKANLLDQASIVIHESNGKSTVIPIDEQTAQALLNDPESKPLDANVIVFTANHTTYMVKDHVMPNGQMMVPAILQTYDAPDGGD